MKQESCRFKECCSNFKKLSCPSYLKQCKRYCKYSLTEAVGKTNIVIDNEVLNLISKSPSRTTLSSKEAAAALIVAVQKNPVPIRYLGFHAAVTAALDPDPPQESIIFINSVSNQFDSTKQYQAIASLISNCESLGKIVIHLHKKDFTI